MTIKIEKIISHLLKDSSPPLKFRHGEDDTLVVIAESGMKFKYSAEQVQQARSALSSKPSPMPATVKTPATGTRRSKPSRSKAVSTEESTDSDLPPGFTPSSGECVGEG